MGQFDDDFHFGARGAALARDLLRSDHRVTVEDVQDDPAWQRRGVDLLWRRGTLCVPIEVKFERKASQNFAIESISNISSGRPGWWLTSEAHLVVYGFQASASWWVLHLPTLRRELRGPRWEELRSVRAHTRGSHATSCRLLPIVQARALGGAQPWSGPLPERYVDGCRPPAQVVQDRRAVIPARKSGFSRGRGAWRL